MKYLLECLVWGVGHTPVAAHGFIEKKLSKVTATLLLLTNNPRSTLGVIVVGICMGRFVISNDNNRNK
jgi:hypothetical protein